MSTTIQLQSAVSKRGSYRHVKGLSGTAVNAVFTAPFTPEVADSLQCRTQIFESDSSVARALGKGIDLSIRLYDTEVECIPASGKPLTVIGSEVRGFTVIRNGSGDLILALVVVLAGTKNIEDFLGFHIRMNQSPFNVKFSSLQMELFPEEKVEEEEEDEFAADRRQAVLEIVDEISGADSEASQSKEVRKHTKKKAVPAPRRKIIKLAGKAKAVKKAGI